MSEFNNEEASRVKGLREFKTVNMLETISDEVAEVQALLQEIKMAPALRQENLERLTDRLEHLHEIAQRWRFADRTYEIYIERGETIYEGEEDEGYVGNDKLEIDAEIDDGEDDEHEGWRRLAKQGLEET